MAFGGYSITVGRGNNFTQSYPFIVQGILKPLLKSFGVDLVVRNAAIGGIPSFPYGWCMPNFLGEGADLIGWDFSMNEGNSAVGLEAYLRSGMMLNKLSKNIAPMLMMLDQKSARVNVLKKYVEMGYISDPIAVSKGEIVDKKFLQMDENSRPKGYKKWDEWGSPQGSPGQQSWHPKYMEHEM